MKPSKQQKAFVDAVIQQLETYQSTNDLASPSHYTLIDEASEAIIEDYGLNGKEQTELASVFMNILNLSRIIVQKEQAIIKATSTFYDKLNYKGD